MKNENSKVLLTELQKVLIERSGAFLCCASFEQRSLSIPSSIKNLQFEKIVIFATEDCCPEISDTATEIKSYFMDRASIVTTRMREPLFTANAIAKAVHGIIEDGIKDIIIDISTFTHEMLLILLMLISKKKDHVSRVTCIYTGAREYSVGDPKERKWLSKGCRDVRSIIGFPGQLVPGRPTCLIVLVGFEHERATRMIAEMEPELLLLGKGLPSDEHSTDESHRAPTDYFHKLVEDMASSRGEVDFFEFSLIDVEETVKSLLIQIKETAKYNHIIVPLNTKLSTIAVALTALINPKIQVCYAEPETYNLVSYSEPDNKVTIFDIDICN